MKTSLIEDKQEKQKITREILEALPKWFGIPEAREEYISGSTDQVMLASFDEAKAVGFICLKETGKDTLEFHVMGVLEEYHRQGIGQQLFDEAKAIAVAHGYSFIQVKTVQVGKYPEYDDTNKFYQSLGFKELEVIPELWDKENPCQIYIMYIGDKNSGDS